jgi:Glyoxalase-like domain
MIRSELDHLVVASARLEEGIDWVQSVLGARPQPGGRHEAMGTHNALLRLGAHSYLEVIAVDPDGTPPGRPRWFALDDPSMQSRLAAGPSLVTWALRCESLATACARVPDLGEILSMSRGDFRWRIAVPEDGGLPFSGVLPAAIQWEAGGANGDAGEPLHPCDRLPDSGCELLALDLMHPAAVLGTAGIVSMFRELRVVGPIELKPGPVTIAARIRTPDGEVTVS